MRVFFSGFFDETEERGGHFLAVDDECAAEDFVPAVFGIYLCEAEDLRVGEGAVELFLDGVQVLNFLW